MISAALATRFFTFLNEPISQNSIAFEQLSTKKEMFRCYHLDNLPYSL